MKKRHTCIICGSKRYGAKMLNVFGLSWACKYSLKQNAEPIDCHNHPDITVIKKMIKLKAKLTKLKTTNYI